MKRSATQHIHELLHEINFKVNILMATMQDILNEVHNESDLDDAVITLLNGISQQLKDALASNDPAQLQAVLDQINANKQKLTDAVTANTPVNPAPVPAPVAV